MGEREVRESLETTREPTESRTAALTPPDDGKRIDKD